CYTAAYEVGIANRALRMLYAQINRRDSFAAERTYCPWPDMADAMRADGIPLFTLETWRPVREADLLGITLQAELTYSNVLEVLDLAGIPLRAEQRGEGDPIVIAGGPSASNPAPLAPFFDAFFMGESEQAFEAGLAQLACTGYDELSLTSLATSDYTDVVAAIEGIKERAPGLHLSLPSNRVDTGPVALTAAANARQSSITLAPEAATQRMRDI